MLPEENTQGSNGKKAAAPDATPLRGRARHGPHVECCRPVLRLQRAPTLLAALRWDGGPTFPWHPVLRVGQPRASIGPLIGTCYNRNTNNLGRKQVSTI